MPPPTGARAKMLLVWRALSLGWFVAVIALQWRDMLSPDFPKTHALPSHNEVIVETQLQNAMPRQIFLQSVDFRPAPQFEAVSMNNFPPALATPPLSAPSGAEGAASAMLSDAQLPPFGHKHK